MMHLLRKYDVVPVGRNDAMFAQCAVRHTSFAQRTSLGEAVIICRRQTSFKKRTFVGRQKCVFCCLKHDKRCLIFAPYAPNNACIIANINNTTEINIKLQPILLFLSLKYFPPKNIAIQSGENITKVH